MRARRVQRLGVLSDDDVTERDGVGTASKWNQVGERPAEQWAVRFDNAIDQRRVATPEQRKCQDEAQQRCRSGPEVS